MWKTYLFRAEDFAEKAEEWVEKFGDAELDYFRDRSTDKPSELETEVDNLLKDQPFLDFKQVPGVTCYLTDTCYQVYVYEDLFLEYVGDDARNFVTSVLIFKRHKAYRGEDWLCLHYDSGMTSSPLVPGERVRWLQLHKRGTPNPPPPVLLRPTANLNGKDWTHAADISTGKGAKQYLVTAQQFTDLAEQWERDAKYPTDPATGEEATTHERGLELHLQGHVLNPDALDTLIAAAQGYMMEMSSHHVNANEKRQQIQQAINLLRK